MLSSHTESTTVQMSVSAAGRALYGSTFMIAVLSYASHLRRMFQNQLGTTPRGWLRNERIMLAQKLLLASDARIGTVAERCGFSDVYHFSRDFKRAVGTSPRDWRRSESGEAVS